MVGTRLMSKMDFHGIYGQSFVPTIDRFGDFDPCKFRNYFDYFGVFGYFWKFRQFELIYIFSLFVKNHRKVLPQVTIRLVHATIHLVVMGILVLNLVAKLMTHHLVPRQNGNGIHGHLPGVSTVQIDF